MTEQTASTHHRHKKRSRRKHHSSVRWRRLGIRLLICGLIVTVTPFAYWVAEHINQPPAPDEEALIFWDSVRA